MLNSKWWSCNNIKTQKYFCEGLIKWSEENFVIKTTKNTVPWTYIVGDLRDEKMKNCWFVLWKRVTKNKSEFRTEKVIRNKMKTHTSNGRVLIIHSIARLIRMTYFKNGWIFFWTLWTFS